MGLERKGDGLPVEKPTLEAAGFDALGGMVAEVDSQAAAALNPGAAPGPGAVAPQGPDYMRGAQGTVDLVRAMIDGYAPGAGWDEATGARMAASIAPVLEKYGVDMESAVPVELVALITCGPVLYQSAKAVGLKIQRDRIEMERAARGLSDPNTIKGAAATQAAAQAVPSTIGEVSSADSLAGAATGVPVYPAM